MHPSFLPLWVQFSSVFQSHLTLCDPMGCSMPGFPSLSLSLLKLMSIPLVMPFNYLILCCPLLLPSIFPSIRVFSNESVLYIKWPKYWPFIPSNEYLAPQFKSINSLALSFLHSSTLTSIHDHWKNHSLD